MFVVAISRLLFTRAFRLLALVVATESQTETKTPLKLDALIELCVTPTLDKVTSILERSGIDKSMHKLTKVGDLVDLLCVS